MRRSAGSRLQFCKLLNRKSLTHANHRTELQNSQFWARYAVYFLLPAGKTIGQALNSPKILHGTSARGTAASLPTHDFDSLAGCDLLDNGGAYKWPKTSALMQFVGSTIRCIPKFSENLFHQRGCAVSRVALLCSEFYTWIGSVIAEFYAWLVVLRAAFPGV